MENITLIILAIPIILILIILIYVWSTYNDLVRLKNRVKQSFSGVHIQLKRRADLIPNLVNVVKGYAKYERETLEKLIEVRSRFHEINPEMRQEIMKQNASVGGAISKIFALAENYPNLKADQHFLKLQESLEETEDQIAAARNIYNANVYDYNSEIQQFPSNIIAKKFNFAEELFFEVKNEDDLKVKEEN